MTVVGRAVRGVAVVIAVALAALLLWPNGEVVRRVILEIYLYGLQRGVPARVGPEVYAAVLNVLVFVPIGWCGVVLLRRRALAVAVAIFALSAAVELVQALPVIARAPSLLDVACNTLGGLLGALLGSATVGLRGRRERATRFTA